jgi:uncharacterized FAD-dependent dehydrogenase
LMALVVRNLALDLDEPESVLLERIARRLRLPRAAILRHAVVRRSLDARSGRPPRFVYVVELGLDGGTRAEQRVVRRAHGRNVAMLQADDPPITQRGVALLRERPVIVGFGPAGMFAAVVLAECGYAPIIYERGTRGSPPPQGYHAHVLSRAAVRSRIEPAFRRRRCRNV